MKQKDLQPWTAKINKKKGELDVAVSERDALVKRMKAAELAQTEAKEGLNRLKGERDAKVVRNFTLIAAF